MWLLHVIHMQAGRKDSLETPVNKRSQQKWVRNVQSEDTVRTSLIGYIGEEQVLYISLVLMEMIKVFIS